MSRFTTEPVPNQPGKIALVDQKLSRRWVCANENVVAAVLLKEMLEMSNAGDLAWRGLDRQGRKDWAYTAGQIYQLSRDINMKQLLEGVEECEVMLTQPMESVETEIASEALSSQLADVVRQKAELRRALGWALRNGIRVAMGGTRFEHVDGKGIKTEVPYALKEVVIDVAKTEC